MELVPEPAYHQVATIVEQTISRVSHYSGPLPRPSDLEKYELVKPGFAERIMVMSEREQLHRHSFGEMMLTSELGLKQRGQWFAMASIVILSAFAAYLAFRGASAAAALVATGAILGIVGIFVTGRVLDAKQAPFTADDE